ncbi:sugar phosphate isomerase/epimerase family protein [Halalkalicoccus jeotgali]|uniref:Sugar phosphate isomerase/epimerase n=1 Tax=Halalkalicoccus jeotgali (strain DSM 18796 / CECT 7217 / JCM 14584 / KCTC 4019 / B3) TaxID=795797 RepID=D8JCN9_HALJB|nr:sugar phosphate isomerase/epimerase family protein [Halalkalicoccus jeotgali]ADJ17146.1 putative sugar phosphate isomerase/epimerase [Halalkalicoccus jeotgali B3]ELY41699.1 putative sugar phosphate isomerase/epimerase [Halalkalicoccus jeotgali B3]
MQFGINTWVWGSSLTVDKLERLTDKTVEMGYDVIEIPLEDHDDLDYDRAAEVVRSAGLDVTTAAVMAPERDLVHPEADKRETGEQYLRDAIDATATLGGGTLVGPIYSSTGRLWQMDAEERDTTERELAETLRSLSEYAETRDVTLCVEPLNRFETSLINTTEQGIHLVDSVDHPSCQLLLDTFHMNIEDKDVPAAIRSADRRMGHVHACANDRGTPGTGHIRWSEIGRALDDVNFDGAVVVESFTPDVESIAKAASVWRPLAPDQDELARDGLAHLRDTLG